MIQKQGHWVPYELKPRDVERRFGTCELLLQRQKRKGFLSGLDSSTGARSPIRTRSRTAPTKREEPRPRVTVTEVDLRSPCFRPPLQGVAKQLNPLAAVEDRTAPVGKKSPSNKRRGGTDRVDDEESRIERILERLLPRLLKEMGVVPVMAPPPKAPHAKRKAGQPPASKGVKTAPKTGGKVPGVPPPAARRESSPGQKPNAPPPPTTVAEQTPAAATTAEAPSAVPDVEMAVVAEVTTAAAREAAGGANVGEGERHKAHAVPRRVGGRTGHRRGPISNPGESPQLAGGLSGSGGGGQPARARHPADDSHIGRGGVHAGRVETHRGESIVDLTWATPAAAIKIRGWHVDVDSLGEMTDIISYLNCAMTHIDPHMKEDSLLLLDVLVQNCNSKRTLLIEEFVKYVLINLLIPLMCDVWLKVCPDEKVESYTEITILSNVCYAIDCFTSSFNCNEQFPKFVSNYCTSILKYLNGKLLLCNKHKLRCDSSTLPQLTKLLKTLFLKAGIVRYSNCINLNHILRLIIEAFFCLSKKELQLHLHLIIGDIMLNSNLNELHR
ncbi:MOS1T transposase, partial [Pseudoatta argentina]